MFRFFYIALVGCLLSCKSTTYYVVRHAEKEGGAGMPMTSDPPLTAEGEKQAQDLLYFLQGQNIRTIYSTNYARTLATAEPTRLFYGINVKTYDPKKTDELLRELKQIREGNVVVVGHSNTVDDIVNGLMGTSHMTDLPDTEYGNVFIVERKGGHYSFEKRKVPQATPR